MTIIKLDSVTSEITKQDYFIKAILTKEAAVFFPGTIQHRDVKQQGVSYEDDYRGNALASTITKGQIDVRFHRGYSDEQVHNLFTKLLRLPEMEWAINFSVRYQGRTLI